MKKLLLLMASILFAVNTNAQIAPFYTNDFEDGTTQGWSNGNNSPNPPTNIPTGGPGGADDNFLEETSTGGGGAGSRMIIFNDGSDWTGSYIEAGIFGISFNAKNAGTEDLSLRIGLKGGADNTTMATTEFQALPASQTDWTNIFIPTEEGFFTVINGGSNQSEVLDDAVEIRILSNPVVEFIGEAIVGTMHIDNIIAEALIGFDDNTFVTAQVYPNPALDLLNVRSEFNFESFTIHGINGNLILEGLLQNNQLDISTLQSGTYFLNLTAAEGTSMIKIVKQ